MEQIKLKNGAQYDLVPSGIGDVGKDKIQIVILPGTSSFSEIEEIFGDEQNTQKIRVVNELNETLVVKNDYIHLESIMKQNDYVIGREPYTGEVEVDEEANEEGGRPTEANYRDVIGTVYVIVLSRPDLRMQVKSLQETVDILVLEGLGV